MVEWVQHEILEAPIKVYNFEVEDYHTYFVGKNCVFVHNGCDTNDSLLSSENDSSKLDYVDPNSINFSQRTVSENVNEYTDLMKNGKWEWREDNALHVMDRDGQLVSYDNRRLMAAQNANVDSVPVKRVNPNDKFPYGKKYDTWEDAYQSRFSDKRNVKAGGIVPNNGLNSQPKIV
ncbi:MAG: hypothetical protein IJ740_09720 [Ruminococcus sp.]|nr:hypothetical protein [Ruminococcus sp.]